MDKGWYFRFLVVLLAGSLAALALWPSLGMWVSAPGWVTSWFEGRISPGLDIRGGLRLMYEVEVDRAVSDRRDRLKEQVLRRLGMELGIYDEDETDAEVRDQKLQETRGRVRVSSVSGPTADGWACVSTAETVRCRKDGAAPSPVPNPWACEAEGASSVCIRPATEADLVRFTVRFTEAGDAAKLNEELLRKWFPEVRETSRAGAVVELALRGDAVQKLRDNAVEQAVKTVTNRIDELQIRETTVFGRGSDIIVEIPGADDATFNRIRSIISRTAQLEFRVVDDVDDYVRELEGLPEGIERRAETVSAGTSRPTVTTYYLYAKGADGRIKLQEYLAGLPPREGRELVLGAADPGEDDAETATREEAWRTYLLLDSTNVTGEHIDEAFVGFDPNTQAPVVYVHFNGEGAANFDQLTGENVKKRMAIVLDDRAESAPVINERIGGGRAQISLGGFRQHQELLDEANDLVVVLNAGALPAPIRPANEQHIGPLLGADAVKQGALGAAVGIGLVLLFMLAYYEVAGLVADAMVLLNVLLLLGVLAAFEATLTLPGIAGIALTVGMAVDANVLITERIREELRLGKSPRSAVDQGFNRAFSSIFDSQLTTFISGIVLFQYGTGPLKGFAVTLMIGIVTSLFTGVFCSRVMMDWLVRGLKVRRLRVG